MTELDEGRNGREGRGPRVLWMLLLVAALGVAAVGLWLLARTSPSSPPEETEHSLALPVAGTAEEMTAETDGGAVTASPRGEGEVIYHGRPNDRMEIALSFDDGPHPRLTPVILDILREYGVRATFFMVGENVTYYPEAAAAVAAAGHEIGNHTFSHRNCDRMGAAELESELTACEEAIASVAEGRPRLLRPPEGQMSEELRRVARGKGYRIILWDVDTRDWAHTPPAAIAEAILSEVQPGDIILMHDFIGYNSPTPEALRLVLPALLERGYRPVTVGELVGGE